MTIDWINFSPLASLLGGALLGLSAVILILCNGKIAGISGIIGGLFTPKHGDTGWRLAFIAGIMIPALFYAHLYGTAAVVIHSTTLQIAIAGLLVGFGTRMGSGCTSGHGVCGLSRFSLRSLVATLSFMATGFITVFIIKNVL